jgi:tetratricopeptide (TPR) repeat protein
MLYLDRISKIRDGDLATTATQEEPDIVFGRIERALFDLFDAVSTDTTVVLIVEDIHWCDSISKRILEQIARWCSGRKALLVCSTRESETESQSIDALEEIELAPLDAASATDLMSALAKQRGLEIDPEYTSWSLRIAEGNPYFLDELAKQWIETGSRQAVPASLRALVEQRTARLRAETLQILQAISMLEDYATFSRLEETLRCQPFELLGALAELASAGMISVATQPGGISAADALSPKHELVSSAALARLPDAAATYLHRRVAIVLETELATNTSAAMLWDCAKHWQAAGDASRACHLARSCAAHLIEVGLPAEAAAAYETALNYVSGGAERLDILRSLAQAHQLNGAWERVRSVAEEASQLRQGLYPNETGHDDIELLWLLAMYRDGHPQRVIEQSSQCLKSHDATPDHKITAGAFALMQLDEMARHVEMKAIIDKIETLARGATPRLPALFEARVVFHTVCGDLQLAISSSEDLIAVHRERGATFDLYRALTNAAVSYRTFGAFEKAEECLRQAAENAQKNHATRSYCRSVLLLAHLFVERGDTVGARSCFDEVGRYPVAADDLLSMLDRGALGARLALLNGDAATAASYYPYSFEEITQSRSIHMRCYQLALFVAIRLVAGDTPRHTWIRELKRTHLATRGGLHQAFPAYVLYFALRRIGERSQATELLHAYSTIFRREPWHASKLLEDLTTMFERS